MFDQIFGSNFARKFLFHHPRVNWSWKSNVLFFIIRKKKQPFHVINGHFSFFVFVYLKIFKTNVRYLFPRYFQFFFYYFSLILVGLRLNLGRPPCNRFESKAANVISKRNSTIIVIFTSYCLNCIISITVYRLKLFSLIILFISFNICNEE